MPARGIHFSGETSLDTLKQFCASPETSVPSNRLPRVLLPVVAGGGAGVFRADVDYGLTGRDLAHSRAVRLLARLQHRSELSQKLLKLLIRQTVQVPIPRLEPIIPIHKRDTK